MMPVSFFCESRQVSQDPNDPWFRYIGTAIHERFTQSAA